ncbi:cytochrome P450 [Aquibaculum arenosum]|uniref:Cytochrome P450 n=1 Tax=Aquibaculum arenosum TaxID=3032591 RepID=A0ABT5YL60_9PROT|nr:cytochrome P450 [Fodinicurvata sp. CAU 1616]MDF2095691.1 cytochrome P450 [Fodinicurvata sp. CAU 1616]
MAEACPFSAVPESGGAVAPPRARFEPPRPAPLVEPHEISGYLAEAHRLARGELDLISIWPEWGYSGKFRGLSVLRRWVFVALSPDAVRHVLVTNAQNYPKSDLMERALRELVGDGMFITNGANWRWRRDLAKPAFTSVQVGRMMEEVPPVAEALVKRWKDLPEGTPVSVSDAMTAATAEVVCRALFSVPLGLDRAFDLGKAFADYQEHAAPFDIGFLLRLPAAMRPPAFRSRSAAKRIHRLLDGLLEERARRSVERSDFVDLLEEGRDPQRDAPLTHEQKREEAAVMLLAGHETSASALSWTFFLLSQAPEVEARLTAELDETLGPPETARAPSYDDLPRLRYTAAVVQETLRLYPPVALLPREAKQEDHIRRRKIPAQSLMLVPTWLLHRHERYWSDPHAFWPERFLDDGERRTPFSFLPFGAGPRTCLGASFAMAEATLLLASLYRRFRFRLKPGAEVKPVCRLTLRPKGGLEMLLEHRRSP